MRNTVAKRLRKYAESQTIGYSAEATRQFYKRIKRIYSKSKRGY